MAREKGLLFILSAPSGVGKSTLAKAIIKHDKRFKYSTSYTTRFKRPGEKPRRDYHFVSIEEFFRRVKNNEFLEHALVHGSHYGTPKKPIERSLRRGKYLLFTIDVQGAERMAAAFPENTVRIFLLPPDKKIWLSRLKQRNETQWKIRVRNAEEELRCLPQYDYAVVNDTLEHARNDFFSIVRAEELRRQKTWKKGLN